MSIIRVNKRKGFFIAPNQPFNDKNLSWEARGVMGYLLSKPDGWQCKNYDLANQTAAGEYVISRILKELKKFGYLYRYRKSDGRGKIKWMTEIYEIPSANPHFTKGQSFDDRKNQSSKESIVEKSHDIVNTDSSKDLPQEKTKSISPSGEKSPSAPNLTNIPQRDTLQEFQPSPSMPSSSSNPAFGDFQDDMVASIGRHTDREMMGDRFVSEEDVRQIHQLRQMGINLSQIGKKFDLPLDLINDILYGFENLTTEEVGEAEPVSDDPNSCTSLSAEDMGVDEYGCTCAALAGSGGMPPCSYCENSTEKENSDPDSTDILTELVEDEALAGDDFADITAPRTDGKPLSEADAAHLRTFGKFSGSELPDIYDRIQEIKAVWEIKDPIEELAIALFVEAIRTKRPAFAIPKNQGIRNDWVKSVRGHLQDYLVNDLGGLYQRAITKLDLAGMTFSRPGSLTKTLPDVVDEPTAKTIVDEDGGFYI